MLRRLVAIAAIGLLCLLAIQPVRAYRDAQGRLEGARAQLVEARTDHARLAKDRRRADSPAALEREARRLGYVRRGETPFVVAGT